ncbi:aspartyl/lysyl-trna synthetase [Holotrichia oblita]|nr:aspartyl/lysyl-trna synthetase [Holotrichia oblita]
MHEGDALFIVADTNSEVVLTALGALRCELAERFGFIKKGVYEILWVTDFPLLEYSEEEERFVARHHPFTRAKDEDLHLLESNPAAVNAIAYDLVINGDEMGGGSLRIYTKEMQSRMFRALGFTDEQISERFGFFVDAFNYGAPPHGGIAFGLDRLIMTLAETNSIRDVIAFPKTQSATCMMTQAPSRVDGKQLKELHILIEDDKQPKN